MTRKPKESETMIAEKEATMIGRAVVWAFKNKGFIGAGAIAYAIGGGSGTLISGVKGSGDVKEHFDSAFSHAIIRLDRVEKKVDRVLISQRKFGGAFLELKDGPRAFKASQRKETEKRELADPWNLSAPEMSAPVDSILGESPKRVAGAKSLAERKQ